jgi:uncharacterized paraquat-inducible protein A
MSDLSPHDLAHIAQLVTIAAGCISLIGGTIWMVWLFRTFHQEAKRSREGLCMHCGYDLRHSKDRCPECGQPILRPK